MAYNETEDLSSMPPTKCRYFQTVAPGAWRTKAAASGTAWLTLAYQLMTVGACSAVKKTPIYFAPSTT